MILNRMQQVYSVESMNVFFAEKEGKKIQFEYGAEYAELRARLTRDWQMLALDYQVFRTNIATMNNDQTLVNHVQDALIVAKTLEVIYREYLVVPTEAKQYRAQIEEYEKWLQGEQLPVTDNESSYSAQVRSWTVFINFPRLLIIRSRRALITSRPFTTGALTQFIQDFEGSTRWFASYQAWVFFVPRLLSNLIFFCKHVIEHPWMSKAESDLGWRTRCAAQLERRWVDLANDLTWFISGAMACFLLTGTWGFFGVYLNAVTQFMDVVFAIIRMSHDRHRYQELITTYKGLQDHAFADDYRELQRHLSALSKRIETERKLLWLALVNPAVLAIAACMLCCAANPVIPFIGGILSITMTVANFMIRRYISEELIEDKSSAFLRTHPRPKNQKPLYISKSEGSMQVYMDAEINAQVVLNNEPYLPLGAAP